jgi:hypothetical protein
MASGDAAGPAGKSGDSASGQLCHGERCLGFRFNLLRCGPETCGKGRIAGFRDSVEHKKNG